MRPFLVVIAPPCLQHGAGVRQRAEQRLVEQLVAQPAVEALDEAILLRLCRARCSAGRRIAICPATYTDATCKSCGACTRLRDAVIGFPAHGTWRQVEAATAPRDVPIGDSWAFRDHRTMAEVIAQEAAVA